MPRLPARLNESDKALLQRRSAHSVPYESNIVWGGGGDVAYRFVAGSGSVRVRVFDVAGVHGMRSFELQSLHFGASGYDCVGFPERPGCWVARVAERKLAAGCTRDTVLARCDGETTGGCDGEPRGSERSGGVLNGTDSAR